LVFFKDYQDDYLSRVYPLTNEFSKIKSVFQNVEYFGSKGNLCEGLATSIEVFISISNSKDIKWKEECKKFCVVFCSPLNSMETESIQPGMVKDKKIHEILEFYSKVNFV
jgi:hypothetical protein